jgi:hypothetical protein
MAQSSTGSGELYSFNPADPYAARERAIPGNLEEDDFLCVTATACIFTGFGQSATQVTVVNPLTGTVTGSASLTVAYGHAISCPSADQCTVSGGFGQGFQTSGSAETFDPANLAAAPSEGPDDDNLAAESDGLACPSTTQCTSVGMGTIETFNPQAPPDGSQTAPSGFDSGRDMSAIDCALTTQCTASDLQGNAITFNPQDPGTPAPAMIATAAVGDLRCPSTTTCLGLAPTNDGAGAALLSGDPQTGGPWAAVPIDPDGMVTGLSCPTALICVASDEAGNVITAPPPSARKPVPLIAGHAFLTGITPVPTGLRVKLKCSGPVNARCTFRLSLAAGISSGPAASKVVVVKPGSQTVGLTLVPAAQRLLKKDGELGGELTVTQTITTTKTALIARRKVTLHAR